MLRVLVVDDSEIFVRETVEGLRRWGWEAEGAPNGREAVEILSSGARFDGVLLDRNMPFSGDEVLRWIRGEALKDPALRPNLQHLCVVMLTGYGEVENAVQALKLGAFQYLQKPIADLVHLRSIMAAGIAWHRAHAVRGALLTTRDRGELFTRVRAILDDSVRPEGVYIMFVDEDGSIVEIVGEAGLTERRGTPRFVDRLLTGEQLVFEQSDAAVGPLDPILRDAKTLMAVPVPGSQRQIVGVLDMESTNAHAFDPTWGEVLSYLADLIGIALEIETQTAHRVKVEAEKNAEREKVKQLGLIYRELRHNIATHAQIVSMQARELLETDLASPANEREVQVRRRLAFIGEHADIIDGVVQDIKAISLQPPKPKWETVDVQTIVRESMDACRPALAGVELFLGESAPHLRIQADRANLAYCLKCLIQNSGEAIEEARRNDVEPSRSGKGRIELRISQDPRSVRITVLDSGVGFELPGEDLFQPLFSTKTRQPMSDARQQVTGADRVGRILELVSKWTTHQLHADRLQNIRKGVDILIRDGDAVDVYVRQGPADGALTISEFEKTATDVITTHQPLGGEWPKRGVGLYSVRRIVEEMHRGKITASSDGLGKGASFTIELPRS